MYCGQSRPYLVILASLCVLLQAHSASSLEILVTSICIRAHYLPLIGPIEEMISRGHDVTVLLYGNCDELVKEALGSRAQNVSIHQSAIDFDNLSVDPYDEAAEALYEFGERYEKTFPQSYQTALDFFANNEHVAYDVIYCDSYSLGSMVAAEQKRIPLVVNNILMPRINSDFYGYNSWNINKIKDVLQYIFALRAVCKPGTDKVMEQRTNLVLQGKYLTPFDYHLGFSVITQGGSLLTDDAANDRFKSVGYPVVQSKGKLESALSSWIEKSDKPIVFISMGSLTNIDYDEVKSVIESAAGSKYRFLYSLNLKEIKYFQDKNLAGYTDDNVFVTSKVDERTVLDNAKVRFAVTHCGPLAVLDAITAKVPIICRPGYLEQFFLADFIHDQNLGVRISTNLMFSFLNSSVQDIDSRNAEISKNLNDAASKLSKSGGVETVVDFLENAASKRIIYTPYDGKIWPRVYEMFYAKMPTFVGIFGGVAFVLVNMFVFFLFSLFSGSKSKPKAKNQ